MNKQTNIIIRLTRQQKNIISQRAQKVNLSVSEYLRESAVNVTRKQQNKDLYRVTNAINRVGNNVNQITKQVNQNFYDDKGSELLNELKLIRIFLQIILKKCDE